MDGSGSRLDRIFSSIDSSDVSVAEGPSVPEDVLNPASESSSLTLSFHDIISSCSPLPRYVIFGRSLTERVPNLNHPAMPSLL